MIRLVMKKILLVFVLVLSMGLDMIAQPNGGFFKNNYNDDHNRHGLFNGNNDNRDRLIDINGILGLPSDQIGSTNNSPAPVGSGLLILTALGIGYSIQKRKRK